MTSSTPSLRDMAIHAGIKHVNGITDVGGLAFDLVRPILRKVQHPAQLRLIEKNCPQIAGANNGELWRAFIKRDIKHYESRMMEPKNPASWSKIYLKLKREDEADDLKATEALSASLAAQAKERVKNQATISHEIVQPATSRRRGAGFSAAGKTGPGGLLAHNHSKGANFLASIRKTKQDIKRVPMIMTTSYGPSRTVAKSTPIITPGKVTAAPINMVLEHRRKTEGNIAMTRSPVVPRANSTLSGGSQARGTSMANSTGTKPSDQLRIKEDRLRALASGTGPASAPGGTKQGTGSAQVKPGSTAQQPSTPTVAPRPAIVKKRPATNCFMTSKKAKR